MSDAAAANRPRALVIGASGTVGRALVPLLEPRYRVTAAGFTRKGAGTDACALDVRDESAVASCLATNDPELVVLCSAISNVAACQADPEGSAEVNVGGARNVARHAGDRTVVLYSSDAVFSDARECWRENDAPDPRSAYGRQKVQAEDAVRGCARHLILRTARLYARRRGDGKFVDFVLRTLEAGGEITAPVDTPGNPTLVDDLCAATAELLARGESGTWHLAGPPVDSLYSTAVEIAEALGSGADRIHAVPRDHGSDLPRITARLDTAKARAAGLSFRSLGDGLKLLLGGAHTKA